MDRLEADIVLAEDGSMELAQRGIYVGRERVRNFLFDVFGDEGPVGAAIYEDEAVRENGIWKFRKVHADNTWGAGYDGGWMRSPGNRVPGPSATYPPELRETMSNRSFDGYMTPEIAAQLRAIGTAIDPPATSAIYAPLHGAEPYADVEPVRDVSYGRHARNVLDVFSTAAPGDARPVVVFVHGGGFERGAKHTPGTPFYDNVMRWAVAAGYVGVNVNYRLAPEHVWPSGIDDLRAVVDWVADSIERFGGDSDKVYLWGHSAGAAHVADYLAEQARDGRDGAVRGAILLSGFYDLGAEVSMWQAYYGDDVSTYPRRSSLPGLLETATPLLVVDAELDPPWAQQQAALLEQSYREAGRSLQRLHLAGHSHLSEGYAVGTADRTLTDPINRFVAATLATA